MRAIVDKWKEVFSNERETATYVSIYAHMDKIVVRRGNKVKRGDLIGYVGNTGRSVAPHLHYEIHHYGEAKNPLDYFFH